MSKNMGSKPATPSVIARLMGLDELPSKQPVKKQKLQRVLSENYLRKVVSIGVWEKRSFDERRSFRFRIEAQKEFKDAFEVVESLERGKESDLFAEKGRVHLRLSHEKVPSLTGSFADAEYVPVGIKLQPLKEVHYGQSGPGFVDCRKDCFEHHFLELDYLATHFYDQESVPSHLQSRHVRFLESAYAFDREKTDIYRKLGSRTDQENSKLLQKLENCLVKDSRRKYGPDSTCIVPRFHLESNNERRPFRKVVILKPKPGEAENATNCLSSPGSYECSSSGDRKDKGSLCHGKGNSHAQVKERKNLSNGVKSTGHRFILSCENEKKIIRKTRYNISDISLEPPRSGFSGVHSRTKETKFMMVSSPNNSDLNNWYKPSCYYLDGSYVAEEAKKQISERWRMKKEFRENGLTLGGRGRSRTLGEMLALPDCDKCANFRSPLGISSRDGWKNGGTGDLIKSRSPACSTSVERPKTWNSHKDLHDDSYMTMRPIFSLNWSRLKSTKQGSSGKDGLERRNLGSNCKKSQSSPYLESEKNHSLEDKYVVHNMSKNNLEKQDPSEESSIVSKSLKHNIFHPDSEKKITPIDQWNNIKDGNMSAEGSVVPESLVFTAESPSIASDMVVAVENVAVGKSTRNHNQQLFESTGCIMSEKDYNSSFCIPDASSQQKDISMKISEDYGTDPDFLLNLETAYQPSPVSVLEAPFGEEILSSSKCLQSVTASLHDVRRQLEFLKSESLEGYSEGPGMVVSSDDDDAGEESLENCDVNEDLTRLFGVEERKDFSYLVDVLTEAGFPRKQDIGFDGWHSPEIPISPSVFETLEKKYDGEQISWKRSARRLLFDRINSGLMEIFQPCLGEPMCATPVTRRLNYRQNLEEIEKELYMLLVSLEKEARKDSSEKVLGKDDGWLFLGYDIEVIGREIENSLIDELAEEIVSLESF
ncbi:hypothetical protein CRYUN_Cryun09bG0092300 [Craigia yunnanensis]